MKRLLIAVWLIMVPGVALAFDPATRATRIGVLRGDGDVQQFVVDTLRKELRERGFDAFDALRTHEELIEDGAAVADFYIELAGARTTTTEHGGVGIGGRHGDVSLGLLISRVAAELRVYDGETLELVASHDLAKRNTALVPTSVGIGSRALFAWVALPFIERAQVRSVMRATAREAAVVVAEAVSKPAE